MPRINRIEFKNAWYHVMNRGAGRKIIFPNKFLQQHFLDLLVKSSIEYELEIHAYCLMDNHFHLLLKTPHANLNLAMQKLLGTYVRRHNREMKTDGPLFRSRYKALIIAEESYLAQVARYIHRNPLEAKLCKYSWDYPYSSMQHYIEINKKPDWLYTSKLLSMSSPTKSKSDYRCFVQNNMLPSMNEFYSNRRLPAVLGSNYARRAIVSRSGYSIDWHPKERQSLDEIIQKTSQFYSINRESILKSTRGKRNIPRAVVMDIAQRENKYSAGAIAEYFQISRSTVGETISSYRKYQEEQSNRS